jgi:hypothetical protein
MILIQLSKLIGANLESRKLFTWPQKALVVIDLTATVAQINGMIIVWPNVAKLCNSVLGYFLGIQIVTRGISRYTKNDEKMSPEFEKIIDKFYEDNEKQEKFHDILYAHVKMSRRIIIALLIIYCSAFTLPITTGWMMTWISGEAKIFVPLVFPYIDPNTVFGYIFVQISIALLTYTFLIPITSGDTFNFYLTLQRVIMAKILNRKFDDLGKDLIKLRKMDEKIQKMDIDELVIIKPDGDLLLNPILKEFENLRSYVNKQFKSLIEEHKGYSDYVLRIMKYRKMISFTVLYVNFIGIGLSLISIRFLSAWYGVSSLIIFTMQVFVQCFEGTLVALQNEKLLENLHEFPWYELSSSQKKIFLQFICVCQNSCSFKLPIFGNVDMKLFTNIMQASYSFLMYVIQFINVK